MSMLNPLNLLVQAGEYSNNRHASTQHISTKSWTLVSILSTRQASCCFLRDGRDAHLGHIIRECFGSNSYIGHCIREEPYRTGRMPLLGLFWKHLVHCSKDNTIRAGIRKINTPLLRSSPAIRHQFFALHFAKRLECWPHQGATRR